MHALARRLARLERAPGARRAAPVYVAVCYSDGPANPQPPESVEYYILNARPGQGGPFPGAPPDLTAPGVKVYSGFDPNAV